MKQTQLFAPTLRENPADAEAVSHQLLVRAGYIRQLSAGVYSLLPLGRKVLGKLEAIIREEMEEAGAQEVLLPALQPAELWRKSGRYDVYGPELIRLMDRGGREFALGPTHEEVITSLVHQEVKSYRKLPLMLYQIQTKFRDERRPRFGLLRVKEFMMKDAYSFDTSWDGLAKSYDAMYAAYHRIFTRCGLRFKAVEADGGAIGGEGGTHEFMAFADSGEDTVLACASCGYAANVEKAEAALPQLEAVPASLEAARASEKFHTPGIKTIDDLQSKLGIQPELLVKTLLYVTEQGPYAVLVRGDHEASETKLMALLGCESLALADSDEVERLTGAQVGFAGPVGLSVPIIADHAVMTIGSITAGANETDYHLRHVVPGRDFTVQRAADVRSVVDGDDCPRCGSALAASRGIEVGHVFKLGTKYSSSMEAVYLDEQGEQRPFIMGCYGIGVTRLMAAIAEQSNDPNGIVWPRSIAPYQVHLLPVSMQDQAQQETAAKLYKELRSAGVEVLLDDREERLGVKLKDADLIGLPVRIVVGKGVHEGVVEFKERTSAAVEPCRIDEVATKLTEALRV